MTHAWQRLRRRVALAGFTLMELLVVVAIIIGLLGLLLPIIGAVRKRMQEHAAHSELDQMKMALGQYRADFGHYPPDDALVDDSGAYNAAPDIAPAGSETIAAFLDTRFTIGLRHLGPYLNLAESRVTTSENGRKQIRSRLGGIYTYRCWRETDRDRMRNNPRPEKYVLIDPGWDRALGGSFDVQGLSDENAFEGYTKFVPSNSEVNNDGYPCSDDNISSSQ